MPNITLSLTEAVFRLLCVVEEIKRNILKLIASEKANQVVQLLHA